jgi:hypothetical protein
MPLFLFLVKDVFTILGRGIVLVPGIGYNDLRILKVGDKITLEKPDGSSRQVRIGEFWTPAPNPKRQILILLKRFKKEDVPIGTKVWLPD